MGQVDKKYIVKFFNSDEARECLNSLFTNDQEKNVTTIAALKGYVGDFSKKEGLDYDSAWNSILRIIYESEPKFFTYFNKIPARLFRYTTFLNELIIPSNIIEISNYAFADSSITKVTLLGSIEKLGDGAFYSCKSLKEIDLPRFSKFVAIPKDFARESVIEKIAIPANVKFINTCAFSDCRELRNVIISTRNEAIRSAETAFIHCPVEFIKFYGTIEDFSVYCAGRYEFEWHPDIKRRYKNRRFEVGYGIGLKGLCKKSPSPVIICNDGVTTFNEIAKKAYDDWLHRSGMYHKK